VIYLVAVMFIPLLLACINLMKKMQHKFTLTINRDNVNKKDAQLSHIIKLTVNQTTTYQELIQLLIKEDYFPSVYENDVVWTTYYQCNDLISHSVFNQEIFYYFQKSTNNLFELTNNDTQELYIKYYYSPMIRAQELFNKLKRHNVDDYRNEYLSYKIKPEQERIWDSEIEK
jgi:hypothetical protein